MILTGEAYRESIRDGRAVWINGERVTEDRRKVIAFELFAQSPPFAHLNAVYNNFDFSGPLDFVRKAARLSENVPR
jgi:aromatic ring hydroxylase